MTGEGSFLVEDFINAITSQLDRVQDALRLKAINRPLTYALKDLSLDLQVFVEMDGQGSIRFRTSNPNETGASTVRLSFTTITKPMIEENTISLAVTRSPLLHEIGFDEEEQKRLEQLGVRNAAQLERLGTSTSAKAVARLSGIPVDRLRQALSQSQPQLTQIKPEPAPVSRPPVRPSPPQTLPGTTKPGGGTVVSPPVFKPPGAPKPLPPRAFVPPAKTAFEQPVLTSRVPGSVIAPAVKQNVSPVIQVAPDTRRLQLFGNNLIGEKGAPVVRLNQQPLNLADADEERLIVELPEELNNGALEVELPDGRTLSYDLTVMTGADGMPTGVDEEVMPFTSEVDPWNPR